MIDTIIAIILAYLIGSVSFSIIIAKISNADDPRTQGSQNAGATNTLRTAGKLAAIVVLIGDMAKGFLAVLVGVWLHAQGFHLGLVALAAVIGHVFPIYFRFKGGKGVATAIGAFLGLSVILFLAAIIAWIVVAWATRFASLASIVAMVVVTIMTLIINMSYFIPVAIITVLVIFKHLGNIKRLKAGEEDKISL